VTDIQDIVNAATDPVSPLKLRHEAFTSLVFRFQDMAFGCAFAVLGDACLAEDAAQEAFVVAWQKLSQLREPAAFGGWLKRIVLSQCNRFRRAQRLTMVPLDAGAAAKSNDLGPDRSAERHDLLTKVLQAIRGLPENERLVTTLFYVNGYTQADIAEFLEAPVSTVNKRLYSARQRLKQSAFESFRFDMHARRPSRDFDFSNKVKTRLRPWSEKDWTPIQAMSLAQTKNDLPAGNLWLDRRQKFDESRYFRKQYVVEDARTKDILAYGAVEQTIYLPKYRLLLLADPRWLKLGAGELLLDRLMTDLKAAGAVTVSCRRYASESQLLSLLKKRGFAETSRLMDLRLDLTKSERPLLQPVIKQLEAQGISISTLAAERAQDPKCAEKLYELTTLVGRDDPARSDFDPPGYNAREAALWLNMPYVLPDAYFIAKRGDEYVGVSDVSLFDAMPGALTAGFTGVKREYRRIGIATALKMHTMLYAQSNGYQIIQTFNHPVQTGMLALNQKLGFEILFSYSTVEKCLKKVVSVDANLYDCFAGTYRDERRPALEIIIRHEAGRLTAECAGQKVELFPTSERSFFVKQFYGEAVFVRSSGGQCDEVQFQSRGLKPESVETLCAKRTG
jgi:RNA polymerase sigma-70 factor (ECF subfamily)